MLRRIPPIVAALAVAAVATACSSATGPSPASEDTKELAPIFAVETTDGTFSLSEHLASDGRPVFLNLWASWCFPCREEMPEIDRAAEAHPEIAFIGVAVQDRREDAEAFADEVGVSYVLGFDDDGNVDGAFAPLGLPASYLISADGTIVERILGKVTEADLAEKFDKHFG